MPHFGPGDILAMALLIVYVVLHIGALGIGAHALNSPADCDSELSAGSVLVGRNKTTIIHLFITFAWEIGNTDVLDVSISYKPLRLRVGRLGRCVRYLHRTSLSRLLSAGGAIGLVLMAVSGAVFATSKNPCIQWPALYLNPAANLCWLIVGSTSVYGQEWCDADLHTAAYVVIILGYIVVIPAIVIISMVMVDHFYCQCGFTRSRQ